MNWHQRLFYKLPTRLRVIINMIREPIFGLGFWIDPETIWIWPHKRKGLDVRYYDITFQCCYKTRADQRAEHREYENTYSDTHDRDVEAEIALKELIAFGHQIHFEEGIDTIFTDRVLKFLSKYGEHAIYVISCYTMTKPVRDTLIVGEILKVMGRWQDENTHNARFYTLAHCLTGSDVYIKDGAALALLFMNDYRAVGYLRDAAKTEPIASLAKDFRDIAIEIEESYKPQGAVYD